MFSETNEEISMNSPSRCEYNNTINGYPHYFMKEPCFCHSESKLEELKRCIDGLLQQRMCKPDTELEVMVLRKRAKMASQLYVASLG